MNKLSIMAAVLLCASAAQAEPGTNYFSLGAGRSSWNEDCTGIAQCDKTGNAVRIVGGHEFVKGSFAIEGMLLDLGKIRGADSGISVELKGQALGVGGAFVADFAPNWRGTVRLGLASVRAKASGSGFGVSVSDSKSSAQGYVGGSLAYAFTPSTFVELAFEGTRVKFAGQTENVSTVTLGVGARF